MRILIAALAEHASESSPGSKLNVSGVFDVIAAESFPTVLPAAALVLRLQFEYEDGERTHTLQIVLLTQDGEQVINIEDEIQMLRIAPGQRRTMNYIIHLQQLVFQFPERFSIDISWNREILQRLPLDVVALL
ncbi:MAG TPA: hypothetical protein VI383_02755 [Gemmatimonadales bacterium]|nr:hypothetical protein [Gemmatimonadales bacterium]